ncbi:hypothetical protein JHK87_026849 [Glycine soja]|nr:hypothetical protein JHK87_026849 [Glycine soja]
MTTPTPLKAVTLTHVRYQRGDGVGHFLAWISLVPVFISLGGFVSHFIFRRELQGIFFALGLIVSQFINEVIKTSVQQARPATCALLEMCDSHGWPSSHCQYMFFFATYLTLLSLRGLSFWHVRDNPLLHALTWSLAVSHYVFSGLLGLPYGCAGVRRNRAWGFSRRGLVLGCELRFASVLSDY